MHSTFFFNLRNVYFSCLVRFLIFNFKINLFGSVQKSITEDPTNSILFYKFTSAHQSGINAIDVYPKKSFYGEDHGVAPTSGEIQISSGGDDENIFTSFFGVTWETRGSSSIHVHQSFSTKSTHCSSLRGVEIVEKLNGERFVFTTGPDQLLAVWHVTRAEDKKISLTWRTDAPVCASHTSGLAILPESLAQGGHNDNRIWAVVAGQGIQVLELCV